MVGSAATARRVSSTSPRRFHEQLRRPAAPVARTAAVASARLEMMAGVLDSTADVLAPHGDGTPPAGEPTGPLPHGHEPSHTALLSAEAFSMRWRGCMLQMKYRNWRKKKVQTQIIKKKKTFSFLDGTKKMAMFPFLSSPYLLRLTPSSIVCVVVVCVVARSNDESVHINLLFFFWILKHCHFFSFFFRNYAL